MRYTLLLLLLISCSVKDCRVGPNLTQQKETAKNNTETIKTESKTVLSQLHDLRENLQPGAQLQCIF